MAKNEKRFLYESFEDRKFTVVVGFLCLVYLFLTHLSETGGWAAKVLPAWQPLFLVGFGFGAALFQLFVWKKFRHFYPKWYASPVTWTLFICEWGLILFTVLLFSWPIYLFYTFLTSDKTLNSL